MTSNHARMATSAIILMIAQLCSAQEPSMKEISLPKDLLTKHPFIACTVQELGRLKEAYAGKGAAHDVVAAVVARADRAVAKPLEFPPRGGQHNQWYQCERCQTALTTIDDTHHQCPRCKQVYSGEPYDDVVFERKHYANIRNAFDTAWAYAITGKKGYADFAAKVLLGYAERYRKYPYHSASRQKEEYANKSGGHLFEQTLNEAASLATDIGPAYDLIAASLSEQDRRAIRDGLLRPMLENMDKHKAGKSNWQTWHNAGMVWGGALIGDVSYVRKAVTDPANGFVYQMKVSVTSDGMWYENSWGYHFYTLSGLVAMAEGCRRLGIDLWQNPTLEKMFTLPARYTMADGSLPRFGDDVNTSARGQALLMECAANTYGQAALADVLPVKPIWETVMFGRKPESLAGTTSRAGGGHPSSGVFPGAGHAILRTDGPAALTAAITFGPYGGFHGHLDKLSFVFFGCGKELGIDPGRAASQAYRLPIHTDWYKASISHNAVIVDGQSQAPAEGKLILFGANEIHAAVLAQCDAAYKGVGHKRVLCLTPSYLLVVDELSADAERRFDWVYHNRGTAVRCDVASQPGQIMQEGTRAPKYVGQEYIKNVKTGSTGDQVSVEFAGDDVTTYLTAAGEAGTQVRTGDGVGASVADRVLLAMFTRRGRSARFVAVIEPTAKGQKPAVTSVSADADKDSLLIKIRNGQAQDVVNLNQERLTFSCNGKTVLEAKTQ